MACLHFATITNHAAFVIGFVHKLSLLPRTRTWSGIVAHESSFLGSALVSVAKECSEGFGWFTLPPGSTCCSAPSPTFGIMRLCFC